MTVISRGCDSIHFKTICKKARITPLFRSKNLSSIRADNEIEINEFYYTGVISKNYHPVFRTSKRTAFSI